MEDLGITQLTKEELHELKTREYYAGMRVQLLQEIAQLQTNIEASRKKLQQLDKKLQKK